MLPVRKQAAHMTRSVHSTPLSRKRYAVQPIQIMDIKIILPRLLSFFWRDYQNCVLLPNITAVGGRLLERSTLSNTIKIAYQTPTLSAQQSQLLQGSLSSSPMKILWIISSVTFAISSSFEKVGESWIQKKQTPAETLRRLSQRCALMHNQPWGTKHLTYRWHSTLTKAFAQTAQTSQHHWIFIFIFKYGADDGAHILSSLIPLLPPHRCATSTVSGVSK